MTQQFARAFNSPWPVVLAEIADFANLVRLRTAGAYTTFGVTAGISRSVPPEYLATPEFEAFEAALRVFESLPGGSVVIRADDHPAHYIRIDVTR